MMKPIPREAVAELHQALTEGEGWIEQAQREYEAGKPDNGDALCDAAALRFQQISARALVTLLAAFTAEPSEEAGT